MHADFVAYMIMREGRFQSFTSKTMLDPNYPIFQCSFYFQGGHYRHDISQIPFPRSCMISFLPRCQS